MTKGEVTFPLVEYNSMRDGLRGMTQKYENQKLIVQALVEKNADTEERYKKLAFNMMKNEITEDEREEYGVRLYYNEHENMLKSGVKEETIKEYMKIRGDELKQKRAEAEQIIAGTFEPVPEAPEEKLTTTEPIIWADDEVNE